MILIIDNYDSFTYNLYQAVAMICQKQITISVIKNDELTLDEMVQLKPAAVILSPGPGRPENAGNIVPFIRNCRPTLPILGVCLGHQAIVYALGGAIIAAPEIVHGKADLIFHYRKNLYRDLPLPFVAARYHSLIADRATLPDTLLIEAENANGLVMGVKHKTRPLYGVQFHPESILSPQGYQLLQKFIGMYAALKAEAACS